MLFFSQIDQMKCNPSRWKSFSVEEQMQHTGGSTKCHSPTATARLMVDIMSAHNPERMIVSIMEASPPFRVICSRKA